MDLVLSSLLLNGLKLTVTALCAVLLGMGRSPDYRPTAVSTLSLIALGTCLFMMVTLALTPALISEPEKIAVNLMLGMIVLGAVVVWKDKVSPSSVVSGALVWITGMVGMAIGTGLFLEGIAVSGLTFLVVRWLSRSHPV